MCGLAVLAEGGNLAFFCRAAQGFEQPATTAASGSMTGPAGSAVTAPAAWTSVKIA